MVRASLVSGGRASVALASGHTKEVSATRLCQKTLEETPGSQLFTTDYSRLYPCCRAEYFGKSPEKLGAEEDTPIPALPAQREKVHRRQRQGIRRIQSRPPPQRVDRFESLVLATGGEFKHVLAGAQHNG